MYLTHPEAFSKTIVHLGADKGGRALARRRRRLEQGINRLREVEDAISSGRTTGPASCRIGLKEQAFCR